MTREQLAALIGHACVQTTVLFLQENPDELVPAVAKMLAKSGTPLQVDRNQIENLVDILQEALCIIETGVDSPGI